MWSVSHWLMTQTTPTTNIADVWIGWIGLAFTMLVAFAGLAYRMGRQTQALTDLEKRVTDGLADIKADVGSIEGRVEAFMMRAWIDRGERRGE